MNRPPATKDRTRQHVTVKYTVKACFVSDLGIFEQGKHSVVRSSCVGSVCVMMTISCMHIFIGCILCNNSMLTKRLLIDM